MNPLRIGVLGAARIAPPALIRPARDIDRVSVDAVAARDPRRASAFAAKHGIPRVHPTYEDLVSDPELDAVYIPLPNGLHAEWSEHAFRAGKHVLCEKPLASNAEEARQVVAAGNAAGLVFVEAFHYRYHPLAEVLRDIVHGGQLGEVTDLRAWMCFPLPRFKDIRYDYALAGGATMDAGCYALHVLRLLGPGEPTVVSAKALTTEPRIDRAMTAQLRFPGGASGHMYTSMWSHRLLHVGLKVTGTQGELRVLNFSAPHLYHRVTLVRNGRKRRFKVPGRSTYHYQLEAFAASVADGTPSLTPASDAVATMTLIDAIYRAAGLPLRGDVGAASRVAG